MLLNAPHQQKPVQFESLRFALDDIDLFIQQRQFLRRGQHTRQDIARHGEFAIRTIETPVISKANNLSSRL